MTTTMTTQLMMKNQKYSAEWIDLLSPNSYDATSSSSSTPSISALPGKIYPPRSGGVSFTIPDKPRLLSFAGYAEEITTASTVERFVVNDLWEFVPYQHDNESSNNQQWEWSKVLQNEEVDYIPGPRLATALAVLPLSSSADTTTSSSGQNNEHIALSAILLGGWDPQTPGTGGIILDDVSILDMDTLKWSTCTITSSSNSEKECVTVPGGPTSRHVAVSLSIPSENADNDGTTRRNVICLHNHRCDDHVLILSTVDETSTAIEWKRQPTTGEAPSSRGLHCAATIHNSQTMVIFGGAAKDGNMSNESFILDTTTWKWTKLDCSGTMNLPSPRAGACLCTLDNETVLLFGGAMPSSGGLVGLNDVWILNVDLERGVGRWDCLIENADDRVGDKSDDTLRPPGRNAATLCPINATKLLLADIIWKASVSTSSVAEENDGSYFLLNGGWYPFRKTYDDIFLLRISEKST
jgi:hypothetical protein